MTSSATHFEIYAEEKTDDGSGRLRTSLEMLHKPMTNQSEETAPRLDTATQLA